MKTIQAYTFHELDEKAKEKVLSNLRDINMEHDWYEYIIDISKDKLKALGFNNAEISFSGFYSQGDGCSFNASIDLDAHITVNQVSDFALLLQERENFNIYSQPNHGYSNYSIHSLQRNGHCSTDALDALVDEFLEYLRDYKTDLEYEIYDDLRKEFEYLSSHEAIIETIECNDLHFLEDGRLA